jgi:hypothetical protein
MGCTICRDFFQKQELGFSPPFSAEEILLMSYRYPDYVEAFEAAAKTPRNTTLTRFAPRPLRGSANHLSERI